MAIPDDCAPATPADADSAVPSTTVVAVGVERGPERVFAHLRGEIDPDGAPALHGVLTTALESSGTGLDIDLSDVTFCDSSGLHLLLALGARAHDTGKALVLTAPSDRVARLLDITDARRLFTLRGRPGAGDRPTAPVGSPAPRRPVRTPRDPAA
ncbi:STAS domain-containing protein [Streptomyces sp. NPDC004244]